MILEHHFQVMELEIVILKEPIVFSFYHKNKQSDWLRKENKELQLKEQTF